MKRIDELWSKIEAELAAMKSPLLEGGLLTKLATSEATQRLRVGIEWPSRTRVLTFKSKVAYLPPRSTWPECRGLELILDSKPSGDAFVIVRLRDAQGKDVFSVLAEELALRATGDPEDEAARRVLATLGRWQRFMATAGRALSDEGRRGLWGELWILENILLNTLAAEVAVMAWRGPTGAPQDFQYEGTAIEVKTRAARSPAVVRISSEQQLHEQPWQNLFLAQLVVDEQDGTGETLPQRITSMRGRLAGTLASEPFEDALVDAGWREAEERRHELRGFVVRKAEFFHVVDGFPRITPHMLPSGIGGLTYDLSLDAARDHITEVDTIRNALVLSLKPNN